jgi:hypothetical protein
MIKEPCIPCKRRQSEQQQYLGYLRAVTKTRAINERTTFAIWFDTEDTKYRAATLDEVQANEDIEPNNYEIISQYS